jgi:hypothetical protein
MSVTTLPATNTAATRSPWGGFRTGLWEKEINVRDFIQQNYQPYDVRRRWTPTAGQRRVELDIGASGGCYASSGRRHP